MSYPVLPVKPSFVFGTTSTVSTLTSPQISGRALRRRISPFKLKSYDVVFESLSVDDKDNLLNVFFKPFQLQTPDDGNVTVLIDDDSLTIEQLNPFIFRASLSVTEFL